MKLEVGMLIETNYSGPYRIKTIERGCTCVHPLDQMNNMGNPDKQRAQAPHLHLVVTRPDGTGEFFLSYFDEETLLSLQQTYCGGKDKLGYDRIIILPQDKHIQHTLF